jgi:hypothetical protein
MSESLLTPDWCVKAGLESLRRYTAVLAYERRKETVNWRYPLARFVSPSKEVLEAANDVHAFGSGAQWSMPVRVARREVQP